jgi:hypothetical protein
VVNVAWESLRRFTTSSERFSLMAEPFPSSFECSHPVINYGLRQMRFENMLRGEADSKQFELCTRNSTGIRSIASRCEDSLRYQTDGQVEDHPFFSQHR